MCLLFERSSDVKRVDELKWAVDCCDEWNYKQRNVLLLRVCSFKAQRLNGVQMLQLSI